MLIGHNLELDGYVASLVHVRTARADQLLAIIVDARSGGRATIGCLADNEPAIIVALGPVSMGVEVHARGILIEPRGAANRFVPYALRNCSLAVK